MNPNDNTENQLENEEMQKSEEDINSLTENENNIDNNQNSTETASLEKSTDEFDEAETEDDIDIAEEKPKAKKNKNRTLIAATTIFAVTAVSFGVWSSFFNNDISGVWATDVEFTDNSGNTKTAVMKFDFDNAERMSFFENEKSYFSDKESGSLTAKMINGGRSFSGWYNKTKSNDNQNVLQIFISAYQDVFSYNYELSGNIFTGRQLKLINGDEIMEFTQSDDSYALDPDKNFKPNTGVVGIWDADGITYIFTSDGRFTEDTGSIRVDGVYSFGETADGYDAIIVKYMYNGDVDTVEIPYLLKGNKMTLTFNGYDVDLTRTDK